MKTLVEQFANVRRVSTPLVIIQTADANAVMASITKENQDQPVMQWDGAAGFAARTKPAGTKAVMIVAPNDDPRGGDPALILNPADALFSARLAPAHSILFILNAHRIWNELPTMQAIWNLRDAFKSNHRTLVMFTTPEAKVPSELKADVISLNDPLPNEDQLSQIIGEVCANADLPKPTGETLAKAVDALKGLSAFVAEQVTALALTKKGVNLSELWERKRQEVEHVDGAKVYKGTERFDTVGGQKGLKDMLRMELNAKRPVKLVVILDEFEKMVAGGTSEHVGDGGVAKDATMTTLTFMQDHGVRGAVLYGHPGCGKTAVAKAMANEAGVLCIQADMGAMRGGIVGESEARVRAFFNLILAIAGDGGAFFVATCNSTAAFTTELRRRFKTGFFFVDLPDREEKDAIWAIQMQRYGLKKQARPDDTNWTGAEIEVACEKADNYSKPLVDVAKSIVTVAGSQPELIAQRRREAHNRLLSATTGETYVMPTVDTKPVETGESFVSPMSVRKVLDMPES